MGYGDALMVNAVALNMRRRFADRKIAVVYVSSRYGTGSMPFEVSLHEGNPHIDELIVTTHLRFLWKRVFALCGKWVFIDARKAMDCYKKKIGKGRVVHPKGIHAIELMCSLHGINGAEIAPNVTLRDEERQKVDKILSDSGLDDAAFIILETGTKKDFSNKRWLPENWRRLTGLLRERRPELRMIQISPDQIPLEGVIDLSGKTNFREAARYLERSVGFVGPEGGLMHLAAAVGRRSVILHSGYDPVELTAYPLHIILHHVIECSACGRLDDCPHDRQCMALITPDEVAAAVEELLDKIK